jgi:hypothetical protein
MDLQFFLPVVVNGKPLRSSVSLHPFPRHVDERSSRLASLVLVPMSSFQPTSLEKPQRKNILVMHPSKKPSARSFVRTGMRSKQPLPRAVPRAVSVCELRAVSATDVESHTAYDIATVLVHIDP